MSASTKDTVSGDRKWIGAARGAIARGAWNIGSAPERDLLASWGQGDHPSLAAILDGVQEHFSSAKVSALVGELKELLTRESTS
ncbi:MAG: hypothetical protein ABI175_21335 [Polyangiales bacterium]